MAVTKWRGLDRALFQKLVEGGWIDAHEHRPSTTRPATTMGRSLPAVPRLFEELALARGDGRHARLVCSLGRTDRGATTGAPEPLLRREADKPC